MRGNKDGQLGLVLGWAEGLGFVLALGWGAIAWFGLWRVPAWIAWPIAVYSLVFPWLAESFSLRIVKQAGDRRDLVVLLLAFSPVVLSVLAGLTLRWFRP